jgi:hypothetical protein
MSGNSVERERTDFPFLISHFSFSISEYSNDLRVCGSVGAGYLRQSSATENERLRLRVMRS